PRRRSLARRSAPRRLLGDRSRPPAPPRRGACAAGLRGPPGSRGSAARCGAARGRLAGRLLAPPSDGALQSVVQIDARLEAEAFLRAGRVEAAPRLPVGLGSIPDDLTAVADDPLQLRDQLADRDLAAGAEVDRLGIVVLLRG